MLAEAKVKAVEGDTNEIAEIGARAKCHCPCIMNSCFKSSLNAEFRRHPRCLCVCVVSASRTVDRIFLKRTRESHTRVAATAVSPSGTFGLFSFLPTCTPASVDGFPSPCVLCTFCCISSEKVTENNNNKTTSNSQKSFSANLR